MDVEIYHVLTRMEMTRWVYPQSRKEKFYEQMVGDFSDEFVQVACQICVQNLLAKKSEIRVHDACEREQKILEIFAI